MVKYMEDEVARSRPMAIEHRFYEERERLAGMTDEERAYRAQWLKDQELAPDEPKFVPEIEKELINPIRRIYRAPWNAVQKLIEPAVGSNWAYSIRYYTPKWLMGITGVYVAWYYFKYNTSDWTTKSGWRVMSNKPRIFPGSEQFPYKSARSQPWDYADFGFKKRKVFLD